MNIKDEALKMAIEALEDADTIITQRCRILLDAIQPAINACKEALEQQTDCNHDWVSAKNKIVQNGSVCMKCHAISALELNELKALEQPAQEPVRRQCVVCETEYDDGIPPKVKQPAQEPVMISDCNTARQIWENNLKESEKILSKCKFAKSDDEQPAQEPVGIYEGKWEQGKFGSITIYKDIPIGTELYTHPHQDGTSPSKWTALTDDEIVKECAVNFSVKLHEVKQPDIDLCRAIEQALRNKNAL